MSNPRKKADKGRQVTRSQAKQETIGEYKTVRRLAVRGYDEEWLVQSRTGSYMLAELVRSSRFEELYRYNQAVSALKQYESFSHLHQNLEPVLFSELSSAGEYVYYVTELADDLNGAKSFHPSKYEPSTLENVVAHNGRFSSEACINIGIDILAALQFVHDRGLVHRNVKPSRIRLSKKVSKLSGIWLLGKIGSNEDAGTNIYIPPEGHGLPSGDLFSLGKCLERIAPVGETEFSGRADFQLRWQNVLRRLCDADTAVRYSRATEVLHDLSELRNHLGLSLETKYYSCFISYSHDEKPFALRMFQTLRSRGVQCWLDEHQLLPGDDLHEGIDRGIRLWDKVLLCASKASLTSWWVDGEINRAFQKESQIMKERGEKVLALIPLNLDGFLFSADYKSGKRSEITCRVAANFVGWEKDNALFDRELDKVIRALRTDDTNREKPPSPRL